MTGIAGNSWTISDFYVMNDIPTGVGLTAYSGGGPEFMKTPYEAIIKKVEKGELKVTVGKTFRLEEIAEAHRMMDEGKAGGKMVLLM